MMRCVQTTEHGFSTEDEARSEAIRLGGTHLREKMQGAFYAGPDGKTFRVLSRGYAPGYVLTTYTPKHEDVHEFGTVTLCFRCGARWFDGGEHPP